MNRPAVRTSDHCTAAPPPVSGGGGPFLDRQKKGFGCRLYMRQQGGYKR
ncbi:hypothetical protein HanHA300_Chr08g0279661 [Helianthus annuus]|nr:hypothetical protein HanHA300_Chr08g0279661 [Helianthus annuus]